MFVYSLASYLVFISYINTTTMKLSTKSIILLRAFDLELKAIIEEDLKNFRAQQKAKNNPPADKQLLAA